MPKSERTAREASSEARNARATIESSVLPLAIRTMKDLRERTLDLAGLMDRYVEQLKEVARNVGEEVPADGDKS